jgi:diguanylate cyclase (GGDEF)-like protein
VRVSASSLARKLGIAAFIAALLLGVMTWTALRTASATRQVVASPAASTEASAAARQTEIVVRLVWIATILLTAGAYFFFRNEAGARAISAAALQKKHEEELRALSLVDDLTGINNRRGFLTLAQQQIKHARRNKRELVLLFVDLDDFKSINDRYGHQQGDVALQRAARVLRATFRDSDIIARLGGDEFVVLAADTGTSTSIIERMRKELDERNTKDGLPYTISFSVGAARFDPEDPPTIEELLHMADSMLYEQKRRRRSPAAVD